MLVPQQDQNPSNARHFRAFRPRVGAPTSARYCNGGASGCTAAWATSHPFSSKTSTTVRSKPYSNRCRENSPSTRTWTLHRSPQTYGAGRRLPGTPNGAGPTKASAARSRVAGPSPDGACGRAPRPTAPKVRARLLLIEALHDLTAVIGVLVLANEQQHRGVSQRSHEFTPPTTRPSPHREEPQTQTRPG